MKKIVPNLIKNIKFFLANTKSPIVVLLGPTASGKTKLSLAIAGAIGGEIISADSRQLYQGMEIGTDALLPGDQEGVPHHMLGFLDPNSYYSLSDYKYKAKNIIKDIYKRKKVPMLVGGTGLYIKAIVDDYNIPRSEPNFELRKKLQKEHEEFGADHLHKKLAEIDPEAAKTIHSNNIRYLIRALEINYETKNTKTPNKGEEGFAAFFIGLDWPREVLYQRINFRVDQQFKRGLIDEVKKLREHITNRQAPAFSSLGCKEILDYLEGHISKEEATELIKKNTRNYAKRQMTWFRRNKDIMWLKGADVEKELN